MPFAPRQVTGARPYRLRATVVTIALSLAATSIGVGAQSRAPSVSQFQFDVVPRIFDGMEISTVRLQSPELTLITDTFGSWTPLENPIGSAGFSLRHRSSADAIVNISVLLAEQASQTDAVWKQHLARTQQQLGDTVVMSAPTDSANGPPASRAIGWRTREATFTWGAGTPAGAHTEQHVFASEGRVIVVFVLSGRAAALDNAMQDFRFFVDRLEPVEAKTR